MSRSEKRSILLVEDHKILRQALKTYFVGMDGYGIVGEAENGVVALNMLNEQPYDLVITDINMPVMGGIDLVREIKLKHPDQKILVLTMLSEEHHIKEMINFEVNGYLLKDSGKSEFFKAITEIIDNEGNYYSQDVTNILVQTIAKKADSSGKLTYEKDLTAREIEIVNLILEDKTNGQIADELFISMRTVGTHKRNIMEKTGCKNLAGLAIYAIEKGIVKIK